MKVRLLTALGIALVGLPILIFSEYIVYTVALAVLSSMAAWELLRALGFEKKWLVTLPTLLVAFVLPLLTHPLILPTERHKAYILVIATVFFAYLLYLAFVSVFTRGSIGYSGVSSVFMGVAYVVVSFTSLGLIRYMENGVFYFALVFVGAWVSASMAYFTGRLLGKHKLCPELSPKKTIEGAVGGVVFDVIAFILYGVIIESFFPTMEADYAVLAVLGFSLAVVSQIGDLFASLIKRERGIKDYSNLLPGHGGILDRFDSCLPLSTVLLAVCIFFPPFVAG